MNGDEFRPRTVRELEAEPPPKVLVANAIVGGHLIAGTGDFQFWENFEIALWGDVVILEDRASTRASLWSLVKQADALRRDAPRTNRPAVVIYCATRSENFDWLECEASVVLEAASPTFARVLGLSDFDDQNKVIRIREGKVTLEDVTRPLHPVT